MGTAPFIRFVQNGAFASSRTECAGTAIARLGALVRSTHSPSFTHHRFSTLPPCVLQNRKEGGVVALLKPPRFLNPPFGAVFLCSVSVLAKKFLVCYSLSTMKKELHPTYFPEAQVLCACGNTFTVGSTKEKIEVEICSACHPFYTGNDKVLDTAGRVEKFKTKRANATKTAKK